MADRYGAGPPPPNMMTGQSPQGMGFLDYLKQRNPGLWDTILTHARSQGPSGPFSGRAMGQGGGRYNPYNITGGAAGSPPSGGGGGGGGGGFGQYMPGNPGMGMGPVDPAVAQQRQQEAMQQMRQILEQIRGVGQRG